MLLATLLLSAAPLPSPQDPPNRRAEVRARYEALAGAQDPDGLAELWGKNRGLVLQTIDADLEGSLALWEAAPEAPPTEEIRALQERALFGARVASRHFREPIFLDYAASFVGWDEAQRAAFRAGQAVYSRAVQELEAGNHELALEAGRETVERAMALGDWWGTAMGHRAAGEAARHLGWFEDALRSFSLARQIDHALGLEHSEMRDLRGMLAAARADERWLRARVTAEALADAARAFEDDEVLREALEAKAAVEEALGLAKEAEETREQLEALGAVEGGEDG